MSKSFQPAVYSLPWPSLGRQPTVYAFTLIELLVVILVLAILMSITLPLSRYAIRRANEDRQEVMRAEIRSALEDYRATYGEYPINAGNIADNSRHYPSDYPTYDAVQSNSSSTHVTLNAGDTKEIILDIHGNPSQPVDYSLTYPLMFRQLDKGARPFMMFPIVDVVYMVIRGGEVEWTVTRRMKTGGFKPVTLLGIYGDAVKRAEAIDPVSGQQWSYVCTNGLTYVLTP